MEEVNVLEFAGKLLDKGGKILSPENFSFDTLRSSAHASLSERRLEGIRILPKLL